MLHLHKTQSLNTFPSHAVDEMLHGWIFFIKKNLCPPLPAVQEEGLVMWIQICFPLQASAVAVTFFSDPFHLTLQKYWRPPFQNLQTSTLNPSILFFLSWSPPLPPPPPTTQFRLTDLLWGLFVGFVFQFNHIKKKSWGQFITLWNPCSSANHQLIIFSFSVPLLHLPTPQHKAERPIHLYLFS